MLRSKPSCPLGPGAAVGTVLKVDEDDPRQHGEIFEDVPEEAVARILNGPQNAPAGEVEGELADDIVEGVGRLDSG